AGAHSGTYRRARIPKLATGVPAGAAAAIGGRPAGRTVQVMRDADCTAFLQWALPQLDLHWPGFRKVRHQVCKRVRRRINALGLNGFESYRKCLETDPREWPVLDQCCHVTMSRFFRDRGVFDGLLSSILPAIAERARSEGRQAHCWSGGCAGGEEAYSLRILWRGREKCRVRGRAIDHGDRRRRGAPRPCSRRLLRPDELARGSAGTGCASIRANRIAVLHPSAVSRGRDISETGPAVASAPRAVRSHPLSQPRLHVFRPSAATEDSGNVRRTACPERFSGGRRA